MYNYMFKNNIGLVYVGYKNNILVIIIVFYFF